MKQALVRVGTKVRAFARATLVVALLAASLVTLTWRSAEARLGEVLTGFGDELMQWHGGRTQSSPRALSLNGLQLKLVTLTTRLSVGETLDHFDGVCRGRGGVRLPASAALSPATAVGAVFRRATDEQGVLACLDTGSPLDLSEVSARLSRVASEGDLKALGELRYFLARRSGEGTTVLALWTDGQASLRGLFPKTGDAPGSDPAAFPRLPGTRRLLSARELGQPYGLTLYETREPAETAVAWFERHLRAGGWAVEQAQGALTARRGQRTTIVQARTGRAGVVVVSIAELS